MKTTPPKKPSKPQLDKQTTPGVRKGGISKKKVERANLIVKGVQEKWQFKKKVQGHLLSCGH